MILGCVGLTHDRPSTKAAGQETGLQTEDESESS